MVIVIAVLEENALVYRKDSPNSVGVIGRDVSYLLSSGSGKLFVLVLQLFFFFSWDYWRKQKRPLLWVDFFKIISLSNQSFERFKRFAFPCCLVWQLPFLCGFLLYLDLSFGILVLKYSPSFPYYILFPAHYLFPFNYILFLWQTSFKGKYDLQKSDTLLYFNSMIILYLVSTYFVLFFSPQFSGELFKLSFSFFFFYHTASALVLSMFQ